MNNRSQILEYLEISYSVTTVTMNIKSVSKSPKKKEKRRSCRSESLVTDSPKVTTIKRTSPSPKPIWLRRGLQYVKLFRRKLFHLFLGISVRPELGTLEHYNGLYRFPWNVYTNLIFRTVISPTRSTQYLRQVRNIFPLSPSNLISTFLPSHWYLRL